MRARPRHLTVVAAAVTLAAACNTPAPAPQVPAVAPPALAATKAEHLPGLHNVVTYAPNVVGGGQPEGEEGLVTLKGMGIKTVVSVDGATPDIANAEKLGLRYVHLPISYDTVTLERQQQLAQVLANCDRPIYVHCHHGKHRSAAALATALVRAGALTPDAAKARMQVSGTAKEYTGLWQAVDAATPLDAAALRADAKAFPSVMKVTGLVATMAEIDAVIDLVKQAKDAGWKAPADHPDLVAGKETARLAKLFATLANDTESKEFAADYQQKLERSIAASAALDAAMRGNDAATADAQLAVLGKSCKECHVSYRDR
ncbi:MAG: hypothetical protein FJ301_00835 [Planctomycetes bacterium]|nr:hypothetical protein [Planctomycetota bacterium]